MFPDSLTDRIYDILTSDLIVTPSSLRGYEFANNSKEQIVSLFLQRKEVDSYG